MSKRILDILDDHRKASDEALAAAVNQQLAALREGVKLPVVQHTHWTQTTHYLQATDAWLQPQVLSAYTYERLWWRA